MSALPYQKLNEFDIISLVGELRRRGIDARPIDKFSMTEINNEITRRRMLAEQAEIEWTDAQLVKDGIS